MHHLYALTLTACLCIIAAACQHRAENRNGEKAAADATLTQEAQNEQLVRYFFEEVYNQGNFHVADSIVDPGYINYNKMHMEVLGPDGIKKAAAMQRAAFSNWRSVVDDVVAQGDMVVVRGHDEGDFTRDFMGIEATGNHFQITWIDMFRIKSGKLIESWVEVDMEDFRKQLTHQE